MWWQFWKRERSVGDLPERLSRHLAWRYSLNQTALEHLRYARKPEVSGAGKTTVVRVFDPALLGDARNEIRSYNDLDAHPSAVQFEGRFHAGRFDRFVDVRTAT